MAEVLLRHRLADRGVDAHVHSAGQSASGYPASPPGVAVLRARGFDLGAHRSRRMTAAMVSGADLVVGMAREHVREAVVQVPDAWSRTFTLKELVRRGEAIGPRREDEPLATWLARVHDGRQPGELFGGAEDDDVADPIGLSSADYERTADELDALLDRLVDLVWAKEGL